jgi:hypothetical protein
LQKRYSFNRTPQQPGQLGGPGEGKDAGDKRDAHGERGASPDPRGETDHTQGFGWPG